MGYLERGLDFAESFVGERGEADREEHRRRLVERRRSAGDESAALAADDVRLGHARDPQREAESACVPVLLVIVEQVRL
jgi:hypothetical protein